MIALPENKTRLLLVTGLLVIFIIMVLWIRLLPAELLGVTDPLNLAGSDDPLYNLRQIEQMLANFPGYAWFDPMTLYPVGQTIHWGPMFIWICSAACILAGATTRPEIISVALTIPPIMAAAMVPVSFFLVRKLMDWKAGLAAAFMISLVSGQYFYRSLFGYLDHHIAEVLFSTIFILVYIYAIARSRGHVIDPRNPETLKQPAILAVIAGFAYLVGFLVMPTMILFAMIIAIYTLVQFIWDHYRRIDSFYLVVLNVILFAVVTVAFFLFWPGTPGMQFNFYTIAHPVAFILVMVSTVILWLISRAMKDKNLHYYPAVIAGIIIAALAILFVAAPDLYFSLVGGLVEFFGQNALYLTIQEARSWTLAEAWTTFNYGLILMAGGFATLCWMLWKEKRGEHLLILIWSLIIVFSTWQHIRYEYYFAVPLAVLGGLFVGLAINKSEPGIRALVKGGIPAKTPAPEAASSGKGKGKGQKKAAEKPEKKAAKPSSKDVNPLYIGLLAVVIVLLALFAVSSFGFEYQVAGSGGIRMNQDWKESLQWMGENTPATGVDYYTIYDKASFTYPPQSYGVMSWWDYGHMITYIAMRIPNANPFQAGVAGEYGAASFFITESEQEVNRIADHQGTRYVITDIEMDIQKFWAMATWYNTSAGVAPYQTSMLVPDSQGGTYSAFALYEAPYFRTMISRLHNFDGSMVVPGNAYYVEYRDAASAGAPIPVATNAQLMPVADAYAMADQYNSQAAPGTHAGVYAVSILQPLDPIPALRHYRLVHESPSNVVSDGSADIKYVKVFEYVPGARIKGEGVIEVDLVTDTGRQFTYRQASTDGEFVVPYSTTGNPYGVRATGSYRIAGTGTRFEVPEEAVMQGLTVN
ncbi:dolichyl-diphosphooligosaccharide--protein glycosyltransferase [Methanolinea mesophila]|uniref:oligosaccharyl transferase, archaeosortase A system-associated n=1 Tax=Methanolinea mesophila TaxID=547055 RepID=UPI001AE85DA5|nr:oligosaccharyl transferase, archaeosortase A system-associated [Methanolinea mesophila]MBP1928635.1 dolichyl-diphosphooligosaccharide--protein glycosyltransferase [Methanolinea mesophila]